MLCGSTARSILVTVVLAFLVGACGSATPSQRPNVTPILTAPTSPPSRTLAPTPDTRSADTIAFCVGLASYQGADAKFALILPKGDAATADDPLFQPAAEASSRAKAQLAALPLFEFVEPVVTWAGVIAGAEVDYLRFLKGHARTRHADLSTALGVRTYGLEKLREAYQRPEVQTALGMISCPEVQTPPP